MKLIFKFYLMAVVLFSFNGCIEFKTLITVHKDGSGSIEETFLLSKEVTKMIAEFATSFQPDSAVEGKNFDLFDEEKLKKDASKYGQGVNYISGEKIVNEEKEGFKAVYSFSDINKLTVNQNPNDQIPFEMTDEKSERNEDNLTFTFTKGDPSEIIIKMPPFKDAKDSSDEDDDIEENQTIETETATDDSLSEKFIDLFKEMSMLLKIHVDGSIAETDAMYVEGSDVILFDINFKNLLENKEKFSLIKDLNPQNFQQAMEIIKDLEGIKVELNKQVKIKFN